MNNPTIQFKQVPQKLEIEWLYGFLFHNEWGWEKRILRIHPKLKEADKYNKEAERKKFIREYITKYQQDNRQLIDKKTQAHKKRWQKVEDQYFSTLAEILDTTWPKKHQKITALVSINPICPRFIEDWGFFFNYRSSAKDGLEIIMHETCHFSYFKKWKEVFPQSHPKTFEYPYLEWHLSEILASVILGDARIQKLLQKKPDFYKEHKQIKINNVSAPTHFKSLYKQHLKNKTSFDTFLRDAYRDVKRIKKELSVL